MEVWFLLAASFLIFHIGKLSGRLSVHPRWGRFWDTPEAKPAAESEPESDTEESWQHDCGADVDHDAEFCHECGAEIHHWTDELGVDHDGLPMWKLGED